MFDYAVVGAGMLGSSCAKYLATFGHSAILVGPSEDNGELYRGAWHDEGRIARIYDRSPYWRELAARSIERYRSIERASGVDFFSECGYVAVAANDGDGDLHRAAEATRQAGGACRALAKNDFDFLSLPDEFVGFWQPDRAGHISPRKFVAAQKKIASEAGCKVVDDSVKDLRRDGNSFHLTLDGASRGGDPLSAKKVVLAPGCYVNFLSFLQDLAPEPNLELDLKLNAQTVALLKVPKEQAESAKYAHFPSLVTAYDDGLLDGTYILPPIRYPELGGEYYLKVGHHTFFGREVKKREEVKRWFEANGDEAAAAEMRRFAQKLFPGLDFDSTIRRSCVTAHTPGRKAPFVDEISENVFLAAGGCGYAAKSADEIGRIAACLASGRGWTSDVPRDAMRARWRPAAAGGEEEKEA